MNLGNQKWRELIDWNGSLRLARTTLMDASIDRITGIVDPFTLSIDVRRAPKLRHGGQGTEAVHPPWPSPELEAPAPTVVQPHIVVSAVEPEG